MNHPTEPDQPDGDEELVDELSRTDPADAPPIAEELARRLATELDATEGRATIDPEQLS